MSPSVPIDPTSVNQNLPTGSPTSFLILNLSERAILPKLSVSDPTSCLSCHSTKVHNRYSLNPESQADRWLLNHNQPVGNPTSCLSCHLTPNSTTHRPGTSAPDPTSCSSYLTARIRIQSSCCPVSPSGH